VSGESLQRILKTLADPTRVRLLALLEREELAVQELMQVLGMAQSRVSRHLGILREAGLLRDRREGTYVFYRFAAPREGAWGDAWQLARRELAGDPAAERDAAALVRVIEARATRARSFFDAVGPEWDALRKVFNDDALRARAIAHLAPPDWRVADVGTGTGILAAELARLGLAVVAVDHSPRMLEAARAKLEAEGLVGERAGVRGVDLRGGEAGALPLADAEVDAAFAHMVLHYLPSPLDALREMARVVRPGGVVVVIDFVRHEAEWMREELGVLWLGFPPDEIAGWFAEAGLEGVRIEQHAGGSPARDLPATFIASARRPAA
jgi:ArsR family transcriptional regulator